MDINPKDLLISRWRDGTFNDGKKWVKLTHKPTGEFIQTDYTTLDMNLKARMIKALKGTLQCTR